MPDISTRLIDDDGPLVPKRSVPFLHFCACAVPSCASAPLCLGGKAQSDKFAG